MAFVADSTPQKTSSASTLNLKRTKLGTELGQAIQESGTPMGIGAFLVLFGFGLALDFVDLLDFTGFGAVITTVVSAVLGAGFFVAFYFCDPEREVAATKSMVKKIAAFTAEMIPGIGVLPINCLMVVYAYLMSQPRFKSKVDQVFQATEAGQKAVATAQKLKKFSAGIRPGK